MDIYNDSSYLQMAAPTKNRSPCLQMATPIYKWQLLLTGGEWMAKWKEKR